MDISLTRVFLYKGRLKCSIVIWKNTVQRKPIFWYIERSCLGVPCEKGVLKNFSIFTGKHLCQSIFFDKIAS